MPNWRYLRLCGVALWTALFVFTAFAFNNCSTQPASPLTASSLSSEQRQSLLYKDEPFAFDAVIDTISYNSCFGDNITNGGVFGIKASASEIPTPGDGPRSGIRLKKEFLDFVGAKIKPEYPSEVITSEQLKNFIINSPTAGSATPLLGLRYTKNLSIRAESTESSTGNFLGGIDYAEPLGILTNKLYIGDITKGVAFDKNNKVISYGPRVADFDFAEGSERSLSGQLGYNLKANYYELYGNYLRDEMNMRNSALTLTFHNAKDPDGARNPISPNPEDLKRAYGKIFYFSFGAVVGAAHNSVPTNLLKSVEERDLSNLSLVSNASWTCRNFMVVRSADREKFCKPVDYSILSATNSNYKDDAGKAMSNFDLLRLIRRHYPASNWDVGVLANYETDIASSIPLGRPFISHPAIPGVDTNGDRNLGFGDQVTASLCVVPRQTGCYMSNVVSNVDEGVDYFPTSNTNGCLQVSYQSQPGISYGTTVPKKLCAQWASSCTRTSLGY